MKRVTAKLPEETVDALDSEAEDRGVSRSEVLREKLADAVHTGEEPDETDRIRELQDELRDTREAMHEEREERIRYEERMNTLEEQAERLREERDAAQARYHESQGKLKLHNSEKGLLSRTKSRLFGG